MLHLLMAAVIPCFVVCCDGGCGYSNKDIYEKETETAYYAEQTTAVLTEAYVPETTAILTEAYMPETTAVYVPDGFKYYSVAGQSISKDLQRYLYDRLDHFGMTWYYPYAVCQIWQESRWNPMSTNGRDHGLCQIKGIYWEGKARDAGIPGADIWDPYAQLHVFSYMMAGYLNAAGGNTGLALSMYFLGVNEWSDTYVNHVMSWMPTLQEVWE